MMWNNRQDAYLETRVLTADPIELVNMLYQACSQAVTEARRYLAEGMIAERSRKINKACEILIELGTSLDHERGGEISQRLALLYDYMQRRLLEANMQQADAPLEEVLRLLSTLSEAWEGIRNMDIKPSDAAPRTEPVAESPKAEPVIESQWAQAAVDNPWSQPPSPDTGDYGSQGYGSQGYASNAYASQAWSL